jgi:uncharacterized protein (TIGR03118 family)
VKFHRLLTPALAPWLGAALALAASVQPVHAQGGYLQKNLVSDIPGLAAHHDPNLVNPWGIASGPVTPLWVANEGTGTATIYNTSGTPLPLVVTIPGAPTGQVFNTNATAFNGDRFLFASATGTIAGWRGPLGTTAETLVDNSGEGAVYLGLAIAQMGTNSTLYAADFARNRVDAFDGSGAAVSLAGNFDDPTIPAGFAPFNIQNVGGTLFVSYAKQAGDEEEPGPGLGYVNKFDLDGNLLGRFASQGVLNAPWAVVEAPGNFGEFGGDILIGNFGDGTINAFDATTGDLVGTLKDSQGNPLINEGLWGLRFGNGGAGGDLGTLYFAAGIDDEEHGLFGSFTPVPEPSTYALGGLALLSLCVAMKQRRQKRNSSASESVVAV